MTDALPLIPPGSIDITMASCKERLIDLRKNHVKAIEEFWRKLRCGDAIPATHSHDSARDLEALHQNAVADPDLESCATSIYPLWALAIAGASEFFQEKASSPSHTAELVGVVFQGDSFLVCHRYRGGRIYSLHEDDAHTDQGDFWRFETPLFDSLRESESDFGVPTLYVYGHVDCQGEQWRTTQRADIHPSHMHELAVMEDLVDTGLIREDLPTVLERFPSGCERELVRYEGVRGWLWDQGCPSESELTARREASERLTLDIKGLRAQQQAIGRMIEQLKSQAEGAELDALERHIGYRRGQRVKHRSTGQEGTLSGASNGAIGLCLVLDGEVPSWRSRSIDDELRRKEWVVIDKPAAEL